MGQRAGDAGVGYGLPELAGLLPAVIGLPPLVGVLGEDLITRQPVPWPISTALWYPPAIN